MADRTMVKHGERLPVPGVELGRLAQRLDKVDRSVYPSALLAKILPDGSASIGLDGDRPHWDGVIPEGYKLWEYFETPEDELADYAEALRVEHTDLSDEKLKEHPYGIFNGRGRNARWHDEYLRRDL